MNANTGDNPPHSLALDNLRRLAEIRNLDFRNITMSNLQNLERPVNMEAAVAFTVGEIADPPCAHCAAGRSQFPLYVRVAGFFRGSCTGCHYGSEGARCSLRGKSLLSSLLFLCLFVY